MSGSIESGNKQFDAVVVGGGHNGLVAAALLAREGWSVVVLERRAEFGGAAVSGSPFEGVDVRLSRYSYLVSLLPRSLARSLGMRVKLVRRRFDSYSPCGDRGLLVGPDPGRTRESMSSLGLGPHALVAWDRLHTRLKKVAERVFPTLTEPLLSREAMRRLIDDDDAWSALFEQPLSVFLERELNADLLRGLVATNAAIGTFAPTDDPALHQNRCFLYHVIGNGTGRWEIPVGGMGAISEELATLAQRAGAHLAPRAEVAAIETDGTSAEVSCADGRIFHGRHVLADVAPAVLSGLLGDQPAGPSAEGSQLKVNMVLKRLPRLRDPEVSVEEAFSGTFHVHEGYCQLRRAHAEAARGSIPTEPPCELYCHSLADPTILGPELRAAGAHTLTLFGLYMPARLFVGDLKERKHAALSAAMRALDSVLAEPIEECMWRTDAGDPCVEAVTPLDLERELGMPGGHIFHHDLAWPFAESEQELGTWGVETDRTNVWLCGAGARRGGGVSGIPGHNAARAVLEAG